MAPQSSREFFSEQRSGARSKVLADEIEKLKTENSALAERSKKLEGLLEEWLDTEYFDTREEWEEWVEEFRPRVEKAVYNE